MNNDLEEDLESLHVAVSIARMYAISFKNNGMQMQKQISDRLTVTQLNMCLPSAYTTLSRGIQMV